MAVNISIPSNIKDPIVRRFIEDLLVKLREQDLELTKVKEILSRNSLV